MKININVKSDKSKIKCYDIESINEFCPKLRGQSANGLLEGMINKIKEIKRMSYGGGKFNLFRIKTFNHQQIFG